MLVITVFFIVFVPTTPLRRDARMHKNFLFKNSGSCPAATCTEDNHCAGDEFSYKPCCINGKCQEFKQIAIGMKCVRGDRCKYGQCTWPSSCHKGLCTVMVKAVGCKCSGHQDCLSGVCGNQNKCLEIKMPVGSKCTENRQCKEGLCKEGKCTWLHPGDDCKGCAGYVGYRCCLNGRCIRTKKGNICKAFKVAGEKCKTFSEVPCSPYSPHCIYNANKRHKMCVNLHSLPNGAPCTANSQCDVSSFCYIENPMDQCKSILEKHGRLGCEQVSFCDYDARTEQCNKNQHGYFAWAFDAIYYGHEYISYRENSIKSQCRPNHMIKPGDACIFNEECNTGYCLSGRCKKRLLGVTGSECLFNDDCMSGLCKDKVCTKTRGRKCKDDKDCGLHTCICSTNKCDTNELKPRIVDKVAYLQGNRQHRYWIKFLKDLEECAHSYIRALPIWLKLRYTLDTTELTESEKRFVIDAECCYRCRGKLLAHQKFKHPFYTVDCRKKTLVQENQCSDFWTILSKTVVGCDGYIMEEHDVDNCDLLALERVDCGSHGQCSNGQCICKDGYKGSLCQMPPGVHVCAGVKCLHGGVCDSVSGKCICPNGYIGVHCSYPNDFLINMRNIAKTAIISNGSPGMNVMFLGLGLSVIFAGIILYFFRSRFQGRNKKN